MASLSGLTLRVKRIHHQMFKYRSLPPEGQTRSVHEHFARKQVERHQLFPKKKSAFKKPTRNHFFASVSRRKRSNLWSISRASIC